jgi:hypothetical protein
VLAVLIFKVANFLVHLPQLMLQLLAGLRCTFMLLTHACSLLVHLQQHLLLVLYLKSGQVDIVLAAANLTLQLVVVLVGLHETHPHIVDLRQLMLLDSLLLICFVFQPVNFHVCLLPLTLSLFQIGFYCLQGF